MNKYLAEAKEIDTFLDANRVDTPSGPTWNRVPGGKPTHSLYHGSAGILVFYIELYLSTGEQAYLDTAITSGDELLAFVNEKAADGSFQTSGFYSGWPGYTYVLNELYKVSNLQRFKDGAILSLNKLTAQSTEIGNGISWVEPIPFSDITGITGEREMIDLTVGAVGSGIIYLYAYRQGLIDDLDLAIKTADRLLEVGEMTDDGMRWFMMVDMAFPFTAPNFAHGGAGVGYYLADLYRETNKQEYLDAAISAAEYVKTRTVDQSEGFLVCHTEEQQPARTFYLGICHGPAGTGRFMYLLNQITSDETYMEWINGNFAGLRSTGAPEERSGGLWQNHGQCCGDAGIGDYALFLYQASGDSDYLDYAKRTAAVVVGNADQSSGLSWQMAEHRNRPEFLEQQTGYMQGAAGIGSFLLHLATVVDGKPSKLIMPETPFTY
ncbi:MAG: lanthionine synthetase LanC family protein [Pseudomonadales bacterium]